MIRITVELVSAIHPSRSRTLGIATITNDGTGTKSRGNYTMRLIAAGRRRVSKDDYVGRCFNETKIIDYPRNALNIWNLVEFGLWCMMTKKASAVFTRIWRHHDR